MRPASRKGGPSEPTHASLASVFGEHGNPKVFVMYLAASVRRSRHSGFAASSSFVFIRTSHRQGAISVNVRPLGQIKKLVVKYGINWKFGDQFIFSDLSDLSDILPFSSFQEPICAAGCGPLTL